jgi:aminomethyltransferase
MRFLEARMLTLMGAPCLVMRSGYTGEDGFEISTPSDLAREIAEELLADPNVAPAGLGARDSLRLEAALPLYGADIDETTTAVEAGLAWAITRPRRSGGAREGGFPGAGIILDQLDRGTPRSRVGLRASGHGPEGRAIVRAGAPLYAEADAKTGRCGDIGGFGG